MENLNTPESLEAVRVDILEQLQSLQGAPSVGMQQVPPQFKVQDEHAEGMNDGGAQDDAREKGPGRTKDGQGIRKEHESELYDNVD
jgi:hypothetical protein